MKEIDFIVGKEEDFLNFLNGIDKEKDRVAAVTDFGDLDGFASGVFMEEILKNKGIKNYIVKFEERNIAFDKLHSWLFENKINKIVFTDLAFESMNGSEKLLEEFDCFIIDHHPFKKDIFNKNALITKSVNCAAESVCALGKKFGLLDWEKWEELVRAAMFTEFSYVGDKTRFDFVVQEDGFNDQNIAESKIGKLGILITLGIIYFGKDKNKMFELLKKQDYNEIKKCAVEVQREIDFVISDFEKNAEYFEDKGLYLYKMPSLKFDVKSISTTKISLKRPREVVVFIKLKEDTITFSARCQSGRVDTNALFRKAVDGLENASGGGHARASGAIIKKKDFEQFKKQLLEAL